MSALAASAPNTSPARREAQKRLGARIWDAAGTLRLDFDMGGGCVLLGYAHPKVEAAVALGRDPDLNRAAASDALAELAPCAEAVRFCADEVHALPAAIAAARALTGRSRTLVLDHSGPVELGDLAAIVVDALGASPARLAAAARLADAAGAVMILDETASSFRAHERGVQGMAGVSPHLSVFGAALANGRTIGAVAGHKDLIAALDADDLPPARPEALAAAAATLKQLVRDPVALQLCVMGGELQAEVGQMAAHAAADRFFTLAGDPCLPLPVFASPQLEGLWLRECARAGLVCAGAHGLSAAHTEADLARLIGAYRTVLPILAAHGLCELMARDGQILSASFLSGVS